MIRVAITGVGGAAGVCCIKALKMTDENYHIIGLDANPLSAGLYLANKGHVIPSASDKSFTQKLLKITVEEKIDALIPTVDEELLPLAKAKNQFQKKGTFIAVSNPTTIKTTNDKWLTYKKLSQTNIPVPKAWLPSLSPTNLKKIKTKMPLIVKPRVGRGARDIYLCNNEAELKFALGKVINPIIQEHLPGTEHTTDTLSNLQGKALVAVPRRRIEAKFGVTWRGIVEHNTKLEKTCRKAAETLNIIGPACIQTKISEDGTPKIFEVNPRIGGTTIASVAAGVNIPHLTVKLFRHERIQVPRKFEEKAICRYFEDIFLEPKKITEMVK